MAWWGNFKQSIYNFTEKVTDIVAPPPEEYKKQRDQNKVDTQAAADEMYDRWHAPAPVSAAETSEYQCNCIAKVADGTAPAEAPATGMGFCLPQQWC